MNWFGNFWGGSTDINILFVHMSYSWQWYIIKGGIVVYCQVLLLPFSLPSLQFSYGLWKFACKVGKNGKKGSSSGWSPSLY